MSEKLKPSEYNVFFDLDKGTHLAFNAMSGAFVRIQDGEYDKVKALIRDPNAFDAVTDGDIALKAAATRAGFIIGDDVDEYQILRLRVNMGKYSHANFHLTILPTVQCNFVCPYCYENPKAGQLSSELQEGLCKWVETRLPLVRRMSVGWFGGEPLLALDVIRNLSRRFKQICGDHDVDYSANITTNGYLMRRRVIEEFAAFSMKTVQVTIDGPPEVHDSRRVPRNGRPTFRRIIDNLVTLCEVMADVQICLRVNYDELSHDRIPELLPLLPDVLKRRSKIYFRQVFPPPQWWDAQAPTRMSSVKPDGKSVGFFDLQKAAQDQNFVLLLTGFSPSAGYCEADFVNYFVVDPEGNLHKCTVAFDAEHRIGHVTPEGKAEMNAMQMARWMLRETLERENCRVCKILPLCMGGCSFTSLCADGRKVCSTVNSEQMVIENLKLLYRNMQLEREYRQIPEAVADAAVGAGS